MSALLTGLWILVCVGLLAGLLSALLTGLWILVCVGLLAGLLSALLTGLWVLVCVGLLAVFGVVDFLFKLIGGLLQAGLGSSECFGFASEDCIGGIFDALLQLLEPFAGDLFGFLGLWPESSFREHLSGFEGFFGLLFASFAEGIVESFGEEWFALFCLFDELFGLFEDLIESILLLLDGL